MIKFAPMEESYLIIEDEPFAFEELKRMMFKLRPQWCLLGCADSVTSAIHYLDATKPTLLLSDIRLSDGLSFDIFQQYPTDIPVIFTTAYDEYAIQAFRNNGIDYLLKPVEEEFLEQTLSKFEHISRLSSKSVGVERMAMEYQSHFIKTRFLVQIGDEYRYVQVADIAYFYSEEKYTYLYTQSGQHYIVSYSLDTLQPMLDTRLFCRIARNCICSINGIAKCTRHFAGRLCVKLRPEAPEEIIVSRNRATDVLNWMDDKTGV
jgi:DNA-binding LytR/AlgR family response regulator